MAMAKPPEIQRASRRGGRPPKPTLIHKVEGTYQPGHTRPRAAREEHGKSPLVDDPRLPAFTIKPRASAIDSHLVWAPSDSRPFWRQGP